MCPSLSPCSTGISIGCGVSDSQITNTTRPKPIARQTRRTAVGWTGIGDTRRCRYKADRKGLTFWPIFHLPPLSRENPAWRRQQAANAFWLLSYHLACTGPSPDGTGGLE